jgi:hypothetical protein
VTSQVEHVFQRNPKFRSLSASMMQPLTRFVQLEPGVEYRLRAKVPNQDDENSAVYTYFQVRTEHSMPGAPLSDEKWNAHVWLNTCFVLTDQMTLWMCIRLVRVSSWA